jgi:hypothetical protein
VFTETVKTASVPNSTVYHINGTDAEISLDLNIVNAGVPTVDCYLFRCFVLTHHFARLNSCSHYQMHFI